MATVPLPLEFPSFPADFPDDREPRTKTNGRGSHERPRVFVATEIIPPSRPLKLVVAVEWSGASGESCEHKHTFTIPKNASRLDIDHTLRAASRRLRLLATREPEDCKP